MIVIFTARKHQSPLILYRLILENKRQYKNVLILQACYLLKKTEVFIAHTGK